MNTPKTEWWKGLLVQLYDNRDERFRRTPKDRAVEERIAGEMEELFLTMTPEEQAAVERPTPPRYQDSIIAQDKYGRLIGFEDLD